MNDFETEFKHRFSSQQFKDTFPAPETKLEPCPFCNNTVERNDEGDIECNACAYTFYDTSVDNVWWNFRPTEEALRNSRNKEIRDLMDQAKELQAKTAWHPESEKPPEWKAVLCQLSVDYEPNFFMVGFWSGSMWSVDLPIFWQYIIGEEA